MGFKLATCTCLFVIIGTASSAFPQLASASLSSDLGAEALSMRLGLGLGLSRLYVGLKADDEGSTLKSALSLSGFEGGARLLAGPGSIAGSLRFLCDPTSPTSLRPGKPVDIDSSLESCRAVAGLECGELSLFAASEGEGTGASCGGIALGLPLPALGMEAQLLASASFAEDQESSGSWRAAPEESRALSASEGGLPIGDAAIIVERKTTKSRCLAAVAGSYGRLAEPGLAFRLEARELAGPLDLRLASGASSIGFKNLFGERQKKVLGATAEALFSLYEDSSLSLKAETESIGRGCYYSPLWGGEAKLDVVLALGRDTGFSLEAGFSGELSPEGEGKGGSSLSFKRRIRGNARTEAKEAAALSADLGYASDPAGQWAIDGLELGLSTDLEGSTGLPALGLNASLELFEKGLLASGVKAKAAISFAFPFGKGGSLELEAALPESGLLLEPRLCAETASSPAAAADADPVPVFSLRYRARLLIGGTRGAGQ
jgi:hypothetical protein